MSSSARVYGVPGSRFSGAVDFAETAAPAVEKRLSLPDGVFGLLTSLPAPRDEAEQTELSNLLSENYSLIERVKAYANRKLSEMRAGLLEEHEAAKAAVRAQLEVIEGLRQQYADASREWHAAKERTMEAKLALDEARQGAQSLSRFATSAAIAASQKKWVKAEEELERVAEPEGIALREMNQINMSLLPRELEKRDALIAEENRLQALLDGRDPVMQELGLRERV
jgi:hypothetical protein